jgi:hypothetical protein
MTSTQFVKQAEGIAAVIRDNVPDYFFSGLQGTTQQLVKVSRGRLSRKAKEGLHSQ